VTPARITFERLRHDIEALATIGRQKNLGIHRMAFSDGDWAAREWLKARIEAAGWICISMARPISTRGWDGTVETPA
jgi:N-carbamoyl-L-amino-acid hydrolase